MQVRLKLTLLAALFGLSTTTATWGAPPSNSGKPSDQKKASQSLLLIGQQPDKHPFGTHEYTAGQRVLAVCLADVPGLQTQIIEANGKWSEGPELLARADGAVLFVSEGARWLSADPERYAAFEKLARRGGALAVIHWGMGTRSADHIDGFVKLFGGCHGGPDRRYKVLKTTLQPAKQEHPAARGLAPVAVREEFYYRLKLAGGDHAPQPVMTAMIEGQEETVCWAWERPAGGRSFGFSGLHFHDNWQRPEYRRLVAQGVLWTLGRQIPTEGLQMSLKPEALELPPRAK